MKAVERPKEYKRYPMSKAKGFNSGKSASKLLYKRRKFNDHPIGVINTTGVRLKRLEWVKSP